MTCVLDASALLAYLRREPGFEHVGLVLEEALISSVNWSEVLQKGARYDLPVDSIAAYLGDVGLGIEAFTAGQAERAARLWTSTKGFGLSLADRACLALALEKDAPVLTADRNWSRLAPDIEIRVIR